jgi:excinuclease UvrABC helicase subunit UvrB
MTKQEFMRFCENYYGEKYDGVVRDVMDAYLDKKSAQFLEAAAMVLVKRFSRTNRMSPGPAEIEKYRDEILDGILEPSPLPDPENCISDKEREQVGKLLHNLVEKLSAGRHEE